MFKWALGTPYITPNHKNSIMQSNQLCLELEQQNKYYSSAIKIQSNPSPIASLNTTPPPPPPPSVGPASLNTQNIKNKDTQLHQNLEPKKVMGVVVIKNED